MNCSNDPIKSRRGRKKLKQAKLGQFSIFSLQNWTIVCLNHPYNGLVSFDRTDLPSDSLKKERLCLKIVLGQAWFELYCTVIFLPCTHSMGIRIGSACWRYRALQSPATAFLYIGYSCRIVEFPIVTMVFELFFNLSVITNSSYVFTVQNSTCSPRAQINKIRENRPLWLTSCFCNRAVS